MKDRIAGGWTDCREKEEKKQGLAGAGASVPMQTGFSLTEEKGGRSDRLEQKRYWERCRGEMEGRKVIYLFILFFH